MDIKKINERIEYLSFRLNGPGCTDKEVEVFTEELKQLQEQLDIVHERPYLRVRKVG
jgi:hypothetical protein